MHGIVVLGGGGDSFYFFLTSALEGGERSASRLGPALPPGKEPPGTRCTGGWVGPRAGLDAEVRGKNALPLSGIEPRSSDVAIFNSSQVQIDKLI
jgi:hypothetical protein